MLKPSDIKPRLAFTAEELRETTSTWDLTKLVAADCETFGLDPTDGKLLGVALCSVEKPAEPVYAVIQWYDYAKSEWQSRGSAVVEALMAVLVTILSGWLVNHNFSYDKLWIDQKLGFETRWKACTRLMWQMAFHARTVRDEYRMYGAEGSGSFGLEKAQIEVLKWDVSGKRELEEQVKARGGDVKNGGHYLADLPVMSRYACFDASSTVLLYLECAKFFDCFDCWWLLEKMVRYSWLLQQCTQDGIKVDVPRFAEVIQELEHTRDAYEARFFELAEQHIVKLERTWRDHRAARYSPKAAHAREQFLASYEMQEKFKLSSDTDRRELFYDVLKLPVVIQTKGGKSKVKQSSTGVEAFQVAVRDSGRQEELGDLLEAFEKYENAESLLTGYAYPWQQCIRAGRLPARYNPTGTVSFRLSGFKPQMLNAPFEEKDLMTCLSCDEGWGGVHADFWSIEPAVTAHYSQDPNLLKVFRDLKGDVYLDLALTIFSLERLDQYSEVVQAYILNLHFEYDPNVPVTEAVKERHKFVRKVAKIVQLAVQYTGTKYTVSRNLSIAGVPTTLSEADQLVLSYWRHFQRVAVMNEALFRRYERDGFLRNAIGRVIRVPDVVSIRKRDGTIWDKRVRYKDLPNRFVQSSAHDILSLWVLEIDRMVKERGLQARPVIPDCHDSTSWQVVEADVPQLEQVFRDALDVVNAMVRMTVPVRIEMKRFQTLAGLKGDE